MNKTIAIVIEDKKKATEKGLFKSVYQSLLKKFSPKRRYLDVLVESKIKNGDAIILEIGDKKSYYQVEKDFYNFLSDLTYTKSSKAFSVSDENTLLLMRDYKKIKRLIEQLIDPLYEEDDNKTVITLQVSKPKPKYTVERVKYVTADPVYIYRDYVRVGWDSFKRQFDPFSGNSYVKIDGKKFYIDIDRNGKEYLSE